MGIVQQPPTKLQLLLFIDERPTNKELVKEVEQFLQRDHLQRSELQVISVSSKPQLTEHFKIIATPTLVKLSPTPRQTLAGKNLVAQLDIFWDKWQQQLDAPNQTNNSEAYNTVAYTTEVANLQDEIFKLKQEKADLESQLYFKERVLAMLAHDLRNPLTAVALALDTLDLNKGELDASIVTTLIKNARHKIRIADSLITDMLEAGRSMNTELRTQRQLLNLGQLCQTVANDFYLTQCLADKKQELITDIPSDLPPVYADEERIRQVLLNLLGNAMKYTPEGGKIDLTVLHRMSHKIEVSVTDNGFGVPPEQREKVFEDHVRLERDDSADGYGIGLSLCRRIIRAHYGQIWVDAAIGKTGSSFRFTLPVY